NATSFSVNSTPAGGFQVPSGNFQIGTISVPWATIASGGTAGVINSVNVNGTPTAVNVTGLTSPATTTAQVTANLASTVTQLAAQLPGTDGISSLTMTSSGANVTLGFGTGSPLAVTPDTTPPGNAGETTWLGGPLPDGTTAQVFSNPTMAVNATP